MAEFQDVMRQRKRLCKLSKCDECLLSSLKTHIAKECHRFTIENYKEAEKIIMDLAAEHPEPTYPTWLEWYESTFPDRGREGGICPRMFMKHECSGMECKDCYREHIPAEIAEKLGIKLKEVE